MDDDVLRALALLRQRRAKLAAQAPSLPTDGDVPEHEVEAGGDAFVDHDGPEPDDEAAVAKLTPRRRSTNASRKRSKAALLADASKAARGWYVCCSVFYAGYGWTKCPPCPKCGNKSRQAQRVEVDAL